MMLTRRRGHSHRQRTRGRRQGDRDWVVDAYADALKAHPTHGLRDAIIHANVPTDHAIKMMAMLEKTDDAGLSGGAGALLWWIGDTHTRAISGPSGTSGSSRSRFTSTTASNGAAGRITASRPAWRRPLRPVGVGRAPDVCRHVWHNAVRHGGSRRHPRRAGSRIHDLGRAPAVSGASGRFTGSRQRMPTIAVWIANILTMPSKDLKDLSCELNIDLPARSWFKK